LKIIALSDDYLHHYVCDSHNQTVIIVKMNTDFNSFNGPALDDSVLLDHLPMELHKFLTQLNGCVMFNGGLHICGACIAHKWHSLREVWIGKNAFHRFYKTIKESDIPFAQDCVGDQFLLRGEKVIKLSAEDGEVSAMRLNFLDFLSAAENNPMEFLGMQPLVELHHDGGILVPGHLILAYPPFCTPEASSGVKLSSIPAEELIAFHINLSKKINKLKSGERFRLTVG
jgi:hypothetical protein